MTRREVALLALVLILLTVALHAAHYAVFRDFQQLAFYFFLDVAFLPVSILVLTLLVDRLLGERERAERRHKMNMVMGVFFTKVGRPLLARLPQLLPPGGTLPPQLRLHPGLRAADLRALAADGVVDQLRLEAEPRDLPPLADLLQQQESLTLGLLANPVLLEHEDFTEVLWAVMHLGEELAARDSFETLPAPDLAHLQGDLARVYSRLLRQWLHYLAHLQENYPYLYSFAVRADPLFPRGSVAVLDGAAAGSGG